MSETIPILRFERPCPPVQRRFIVIGIFLLDLHEKVVGSFLSVTDAQTAADTLSTQWHYRIYELPEETNK